MHTLGNDPRIRWSWGTATFGESLPQFHDCVLRTIDAHKKDPSVLFLDMTHGSRVVTSSVLVADPRLREQFVELLEHKGIGKTMKEVLAMPAPR